MLGPFLCIICSPRMPFKNITHGCWRLIFSLAPQSLSFILHQVMVGPLQMSVHFAVCQDKPYQFVFNSSKSPSPLLENPPLSLSPCPMIRALQSHLALSVWGPWRMPKASPRPCHPALAAMSKPACLIHMHGARDSSLGSGQKSESITLALSTTVPLLPKWWWGTGAFA